MYKMDLFGFKEKINRGRFLIDKIKYSRKRHFYFIIPAFIFLIITVFIFIYINQRIEIKRKENILKSYYQESDTGSSDRENGAGADDRLDKEKEKSFETGEELYQEEVKNGDGLVQGSGLLKAYICGEVKKPGVYEIKNGSRVIDLLELAGGQSADACLEVINLAQKVFDGQRIYIPSMEEIDSGGFSFGIDYSEDSSNSGFRNININSAGTEELKSLPGIGPVTAKNIIDYRNTNGLFKSKEELQNVTGIGEKKYERIEHLISI
jgi:competence protein ComEA